MLLNSAMVAERSDYLGAAPYERSANRVSYANGYKDKALNSMYCSRPGGLGIWVATVTFCWMHSMRKFARVAKC